MVEFWRLGGAPVPFTGLSATAARLEGLGWDGMAFSEGQGGAPDLYVSMAVAALGTSRLKVGTGVAVPTRPTQVTANAMATVHGISGGRATFTIGRGDGAMHQLGRNPMNREAFEIYVTQLQQYLRREVVMLGDFASTLSSLFERDRSLDIAKPKVEIAATGPKVIDIAARVADGVSFSVGANPERLAAVMSTARERRQAAGLDPSAMTLSCFIPIAVGTTPEQVHEARDHIRGAVMTQSRFTAFPGAPRDGLDQSEAKVVERAVVELAAAYRTHGSRWRDGGSGYPTDFVDDDFVDRFAVVGSPARCAERLQEIIDLGFTKLVLITKTPGRDPDESNAARIAQEVFPLLRHPA
ncbi:MAG: LLM class flavin-dependent oxidoreductase [Frankia sp.]